MFEQYYRSSLMYYGNIRGILSQLTPGLILLLFGFLCIVYGIWKGYSRNDGKNDNRCRWQQKGRWLPSVYWLQHYHRKSLSIPGYVGINVLQCKPHGNTAFLRSCHMRTSLLFAVDYIGQKKDTFTSHENVLSVIVSVTFHKTVRYHYISYVYISIYHITSFMRKSDID